MLFHRVTFSINLKFLAHAIFGNVRYMSAEGLERKFDMNIYLKYVNGLR